MSGRRNYDDRVAIRVRGTSGNLEGAEVLVLLGETVTIGRSRRCNLHPPGLGAADREAYRRLSRLHCRVTLSNPRHVVVEDLSSNGTRVDGHHVDRTVIENLEERTVVLEMGGATVALSMERTADT